jgi:hypothetical protein
MFIDESHYEAHEENLSPAKARSLPRTPIRGRQAEIVFDEGEILFSELRVFAGYILLYSLHSLWLRLSSDP